jgi:hypothetical protein
MYHDHKATYWWYGMKRDVAEYITLLQQHSESQGFATMTCWIVATLANTQVKVERDFNGFCRGIT